MAVSPAGTAYELSGPESGPAVVLIHGLGLNRHQWRWLLPSLGSRWRALAYDLAGHGESGPPPPDPALAHLSNQLAELLNHLGIGRAAVVGFSLGGMVARRFAQDHPDRTAALAILHSAHRRSAAAQAAVRSRVEQARAGGPGATVEEALERWFTDAFLAAGPEEADLVRGWVLANDPATYPAMYRILAEGVEEVVAPEPPVACPALVLTADGDPGNGPDMARAIVREITGAELVILPGLRHMALAERPESVNGPLLGFLERHRRESK